VTTVLEADGRRGHGVKLYTNGALILVRLGKMSLRHTKIMIPRGPVDEITKEPKIDSKRVTADPVAEIQQQMQTLGLTDPIKALTQSRKDAGALLAAHDSVNGKYIGSIWKLFLNNPKEAWARMVVMLGAHGVTPFPGPQILGAITGAVALGSKARSAGAKVGGRLQSELPPESFQTRTPAMEPRTYDYKNPDEGFDTPKAAPRTPQSKAGDIAAIKNQPSKPETPTPSTKASKANAVRSIKKPAVSGEVMPKRGAPKLGLNEPSKEVAGGGVIDNVFGEKTFTPSVREWVEKHGFEVRPTSEKGTFEVGIPWTNSSKGTKGISWEKFSNLKEARDILGY
jgi:hypothetical protein